MNRLEVTLNSINSCVHDLIMKITMLFPPHQYVLNYTLKSQVAITTLCLYKRARNCATRRMKNHSIDLSLVFRMPWLASSLYSNSLCMWGPFSVDHVLSCPKGGLLSLRHNEIRDLTATLLTEVCFQVCTEPELQPVNNPDEFHLILKKELVWVLPWIVFGVVAQRYVLLMFMCLTHLPF